MKQKIDVVKVKNNKPASNRAVPSLGDIAEDLRDVTKRDYKLIVKISRYQRKIDRKAKKLREPTDAIERMRLLSNREYRQAIKLSASLRAADAAYRKADAVEEEAIKERHEQQMLATR